MHFVDHFKNLKSHFVQPSLCSLTPFSFSRHVIGCLFGIATLDKSKKDDDDDDEKRETGSGARVCLELHFAAAANYTP